MRYDEMIPGIENDFGMFDDTIVADVPKNPADFRRVFDEDGVQAFTMFEIVNSRGEPIFEFHLRRAKVKKESHKTVVSRRASNVEKLAAFYAANAHLELSPFEDESC